jgi:endonuclease/exonuclease/phosphatase family metal-dependent hydrolase
MNDIFQGQYAPPSNTSSLNQVRVLNWNIKRGINLAEIMSLIGKLEPDLCIFQEVDLSAERTGRQHVADLLAAHFQFNYVFGVEFEELSEKSERDRTLQGQAVLTRCHIAEARILRFNRQSDISRSRWFLPRWAAFQRLRGGRMALVVELVIGRRQFVVYNLHLESRGDDDLRMWQLSEVVRDSRRYSEDTPVMIAGGLNTRSSRSLLRRYLLAAGFQDAWEGSRYCDTKPSGETLDWIFTRGPADCSETKVHQEIRASGRYPLSTNLTLNI